MRKIVASRFIFLRSRASRALAVLAVFAACCVGSIAAAQQDFPARPIRIIDGFPPGGATNFIDRIVGEKLTERFGQPVIVDNRPGAGSNVGAALAAKASPDGYTLFMALSSTLAPAPSLYTKLTFDLIKDFTYVGLIATGVYVLVVNPSLPVQSLPELIAYAKDKPGQLRYGSGGVATPLHLAGELLKYRGGVDMVHVAYKGAAPLVVAITAGEIQLGFSSIAGAIGLINSGRLRPLAVSGAKRTKALASVPTVAESGFPGFDVTGRYGLLAPHGTPGGVVKLLNDELGRIVAMPDVQSRFASVGLETAHGTPDEFREMMKREVELWRKVIKDARIQAIE